MKIGNREIGPGHPIFIVAECGLNHDGDLSKALALVRAAKKCGADAFKIACFGADCFVVSGAARWKEEDQHAMFKRYELTRIQVMAIAEECQRVGLIFFGTPDCEQHALWLVNAGAAAIKIGSDDLTNIPLIQHAAGYSLPIIISTGMGSAEDVDRAIGAVIERRDELGDATNLAVLHCVSSYPCAPGKASLRRLSHLIPQRHLDRHSRPIVIGFSDHTEAWSVAQLAVALGASIIEKHVTLDKGAPGPDHAFSAQAAGYDFEVFCAGIRQAEQALGPCVWTDERPDQDMRPIARRSIVAARDTPAGAQIAAVDLAFKRPGTGLMPYQAAELHGRMLRVDVKKDQPITLDMFA